jgi:hypothetical protein
MPVNKYPPSELVTWLRLKFLSALDNVTFAPGTGLPCGSLIVPRNEDEPVCANAATGIRTHKVKSKKILFMTGSSSLKMLGILVVGFGEPLTLQLTRLTC